MITWAYNQPPYMEAGPQLYNDMVLAYNNGAKYIVVFDTNENYTQNVLTQSVSPQGQGGQLDAMKQFWQYVQANPRTITPASDRTAYVMPENYAYAFGGPDDKIWGLWKPDSLTVQICKNVVTLLHTDFTNLDIVYPSPTLESAGYKNLIYWNDPGLNPTPSPTPLPTPKQENFLLFYSTSVFLYAGVAGIIAAVTITALKFRTRRRESAVRM